MEPGSVICEGCETEVPPHFRTCQGCGKDVAFPNVRVAESPTESNALDKRYSSALVSARAQKTTSILNDFEEAFAASQCVVTLPFGKLRELLQSENALRVSFHKQVATESRIPENNQYDRNRPTVEGKLFPFYQDEMQYGALSLDGRGVDHYGGASVTLKTNMIKTRTTAFEENSYTFCIVTHNMALDAPLPSGYRSTWDRRAKLAVAKLHGKLVVGTTQEAFPEVLLSNGSGGEEDNFIELHIYGNLNRVAVERIIAKTPKLREDKLLWSAVKDEAEKLGIPFETVS